MLRTTGMLLLCMLLATCCVRDPTAMDRRCGGVSWGDDELALVYESWWKTRRSVIHTIAPSRPQDGMQVPLLSPFGIQIWLQLMPAGCLPACNHVRKVELVCIVSQAVLGCHTVWLLKSKKDECTDGV